MEIILGIVIFFVIAVLICALFLQFSARLVGVNDAAFGDSVRIIVYTWIVTFAVSLIFNVMGLTLLGGIAGLVIAIFFIARHFRLPYLKALVVWLVNVLVWFGVILLLVFFFGGASGG
jgi:hypothetical protein